MVVSLLKYCDPWEYHSKDGVACCIHGTSCEVAKKQREVNDDEDLFEHYVNLVDSKRDKNASRDEVIKSLAEN
ncbi:hypothetical protein KIN20_003726 [Parelaphostrongylus tenuis]|uniref:Uncharacterized protein n=1 Tax=Parelaphostrongylus tenuis TaxID=148309 RepID=A0AAD5MG61_PARTN|nr:hypothetical protein KIN20_003726 [Parelaphostrongylus tenuis]